MVAQPSGIVFPTFRGIVCSFVVQVPATKSESTPHWNQVVEWRFEPCRVHRGSSEVKFPTTWTDEKQRWEESEKRREAKRREEKRREEKRSCTLHLQLSISPSRCSSHSEYKWKGLWILSTKWNTKVSWEQTYYSFPAFLWFALWSCSVVPFEFPSCGMLFYLGSTLAYLTYPPYSTKPSRTQNSKNM